jgi:hypothetical protein
MKTLDEGKRTAEAAKRDAERKLKTAQAVKENLEKRILSAEAALETLGDRQIQADQRVKDEVQSGQKRRTDIESERLAKLQSTEDAEKNLETLRAKIASLEQRVCEEQKNLKAAEQNLRERSYARAQQAAAAASTGATPHSFSRSGHGSSDALHLMSNGYGSGEPFLFGQPRSVSDSVSAAAAYDDGRNSVFEDLHRSSPTHAHFPHQHSSRRVSQDFGGSGMGGAGIQSSDAPFQPFGGPQPYSDHSQNLELPTHSSVFSRGSPSIGGPGRASQMLHPRSQQDMAGAFTPNQANENMQAHMMPPVSPFSTDLLPSNLFASADDDEAHPGVMPGTRSEAIEAALGRFGLDTSDQSDVEGTQSDKDTVDAVLERALGPLSEHESEEEAQVAPKATNARSWWGSNKARQLGKERQIESAESTAGAPQEGSDSDGEAVESGAAKQQRKAFGSFPRLSLNQLNPSAKVFRSASRKQADADALKGLNREGFGSQGYLGSTATVARPVDWSTPSIGDHSSNSSLHGHGGNNSAGGSFDAVRRAFEASNPPDDEEGRRSWSAFDQWSQRQGFQPTASRMNGNGRALGGAMGQQHPAAAPRSISSSTHRSAGPGATDSNQDGFQVWPEDLFSPLNRTASSHSAGASIGSSVPSSSQQEASPLAPRDRPTNRSRFAFWSQNSKASLNSAGSANSEPQLSSSASGGASNSVLPTNSNASGASSGSPSQSAEGDKGDQAPASSSKPKRSFRWSRRSQTANSQASAASDADADEE